MRLLALVVLLAVPLAAAAQPRARALASEGAHDRQSDLLAELEFGEGSTRLPAASVSRLVQVAAWATDHFDGLIVIDGHADARGPAAGNVRLSLRRARLVRDELLALGVDPSQLVISAFDSEGRRLARVAVWGTYRMYRSTDSVIARRR